MIGRMTASFNASLAAVKPATSLHLMFGFSTTMASLNLLCIFFFSGSSSSESPSESEKDLMLTGHLREQYLSHPFWKLLLLRPLLAFSWSPPSIFIVELSLKIFSKHSQSKSRSNLRSHSASEQGRSSGTVVKMTASRYNSFGNNKGFSALFS